MTLKAFWAAIALAAISVGLVLPTPGHRAEAKSQFDIVELERR